MKRRLLNILTALSLLLCVAVCVLWVRSYFVTDRIFVNWFRTRGPWTDWIQDQACVGRGGIGFSRYVKWDTASDYRQRTEAHLRSYGIPPRLYEQRTAEYPNFKLKANESPRLGFKYGTLARAPRPPNTYYAWWCQVIVPMWAIVPWLAAMPAWRGWRMWRTRRRYGAGMCPRCGYDLRATPDRCPECGEPGER